MKVATWNTFLAPGMVDRPLRLPRVLSTLTQLARDHKVDVLALQELHGYRRGPLTTWWASWASWAGRWVPPGLLRLVSERAVEIGAVLCSLLEGRCGARADDVHAPYRDAVLAHCRTLGWVHQHVPLPSRARAGTMDCGVVLLSSSPLEDCQYRVLQGDMVHTPGAVGARVGGVRVWAVHLLPRLPPTIWEYRAVRRLNALCGIDTVKRANDNLRQITECLAAEPTLVLGDTNAPVATVQSQWRATVLRLLSPDANTLCPSEPEAPLCIDQVWGHRVSTHAAGRVLRGQTPLVESMGSDHAPVIVEVHALHEFSSTEQVHPTAKINQ